jgi:hypothetical protein
MYELFLALEESLPVDVVLSPAFNKDQRAEIGDFGIERSFDAISAITLEGPVAEAGLEGVFHGFGGVLLVANAVSHVLKSCVVRAAVEVLTTMRNRSAKFGDQFVSQGWSRIRPIVLAGPPGAGCSAIMSKIYKANSTDFSQPIVHTCKNPAEGEKDGVDYHFTSRDVMITMGVDCDFLVQKEVSGQLYGTALHAIAQVAKHGQVSVLKTTVQGAETAKSMKFDPEPIFICIKPCVVLHFVLFFVNQGVIWRLVAFKDVGASHVLFGTQWLQEPP